MHRLVEHEQFKSAAQLLHQKQQLEAHVWSKPDLSLYDDEGTQGELAVSLVDLVRVFQQVLERRKQVTKIELRHDTWTVERMMEVLRAQLLTTEEGVELAAFFESCPSRSAMICALLAVLELVRLQAIVLTQTEIFGSIAIRKHKMFDVVFAGGELSATVRTPHSIDGGTESGESNATAAGEAAEPGTADDNAEPGARSEIVESRRLRLNVAPRPSARRALRFRAQKGLAIKPFFAHN